MPGETSPANQACRNISVDTLPLGTLPHSEGIISTVNAIKPHLPIPEKSVVSEIVLEDDVLRHESLLAVRIIAAGLYCRRGSDDGWGWETRW